MSLHIAGSGDIAAERQLAELTDRDAKRGTNRNEKLLRGRVFQVSRGPRVRRGLTGCWGRPRIVPATGVIVHLHGRA